MVRIRFKYWIIIVELNAAGHQRVRFFARLVHWLVIRFNDKMTLKRKLYGCLDKFTQNFAYEIS